MENSETPALDNISKTEEIRRVAGDLKVTDITPENLKDQVPVVLIPGWAETPATHRDTLKMIAGLGRRAIAIRIPRIGGVKPEGANQQSEYNKALALIDTLNKKQIKTVDLIAHSEGALSAIIAAEIFAKQRQSGRIRNIIFVEPVGLIGKDRLRNLVGRWGVMLAKDAIRFVRGSAKDKKNLLRASNEANKYVLTNPIKTLAEARAIAAADIYESLVRLKELGIKTSVIHAVGDTLFPMERVLETAIEKGGIDITGFYSVKGDHREISVHPEKYVALAINALENLRDASGV